MRVRWLVSWKVDKMVLPKDGWRVEPMVQTKEYEMGNWMG